MIGFISLEDGIENGGNAVELIERDASGGAAEDGIRIDAATL